MTASVVRTQLVPFIVIQAGKKDSRMTDLAVSICQAQNTKLNRSDQPIANTPITSI